MRKYAPLILILIGLSVAAGVGAEPRHLTYAFSYQGLLSAGMKLDIATARVALSDDSETVDAIVSTQGHDTAELLMPIRLCYRSRRLPDQDATLISDWWSRIGSKAYRGQLIFDPSERQITRRQAERKLQKDASVNDEPFGAFTRVSAAPLAPDQDLDRMDFPPGVGPMDRLGLMLWLRRQTLEPGAVLQPAVSNGRQLIGYRVEMEGVDTLTWNGVEIATDRIRLTPRFTDDSDDSPALLWLGRDANRLPLKLMVRRGLGSFEARLLAAADQAGTPPAACRVPESEGLVMPEVP